MLLLVRIVAKELNGVIGDNMTKRGKPGYLILVIIFSFWILTPTVQAQSDPPLEPAFILLHPEDSHVLKMAQVKSLIEASGGRIIHTFAYRALIAKVSPLIIQQLLALPPVASVFTVTVDLSMMDIYGPEARRFADAWNGLLTAQSGFSVLNEVMTGDLAEQEHAFIAPDLPPGDALSLAAGGSVTPGYYQTSEYMAGSVAVGIILVESNGSLDPSTEDWTNDEKQLVFSEIVAALNWWAGREPRANLSFVYDDHFSNPLPTRVEPITRPYFDQQYWIADAMTALGYSASSYFTQVRDYNNALRAAYQTDWAFTIFVVDSSNDADNYFSGGYFAYAYLGGPFMVMTYGNNGYGPHNMDAVAAHEIGHIFQALDQYSSARQSCTRRSGYLDIENQNSLYGACASNVTSIMRGQTYPYAVKAVDAYAAGQVGWRDSDGDNILDPLDTALPVTIETISQGDDYITVSGTANIIPYPSPSRTSVTINTLVNVQYRLDGGAWQSATAADGSFDATTEGYHFMATSLRPGLHTLDVAALDSAGNISDSYATRTITVLDPIDGGLNTELYPVTGGAASIVEGVAYHLQDGLVAQVECRISGDLWQPASPKDGLFDSDYEPFMVAIDPNMVEPGTHLIEARASDAEGRVEVNFASQEIEISRVSTTFLPLLALGR
jgi:hypothetical protein